MASTTTEENDRGSEGDVRRWVWREVGVRKKADEALNEKGCGEEQTRAEVREMKQ